MSVKITSNNFPQAIKAIDGVFDGALNRTCDVGEAVAKSHVPTDAERAKRESRDMLRETIHHEDIGRNKRALIAGSAEVDFGRFQEFGTTVHSATPFMGPATTAMEMIFGREVGREVRARFSR